MVRTSFAVLALVSLMASVTPASAQIHEDDRRGFWFGVGLAPGQGKCDFDIACSTEAKLGFSGYVHGGGSVSPKILVGVEVIGWVHSNPDTTRQFGMASGVLVIFPLYGRGLHVKGGAGAGIYQEKTDPGGVLVSGNGFAAQFGAGWDFSISNRITIVPFAQYLFGTSWDTKRDRLPLFGSIDFKMIQIGIAARWH